MINYSVIIPHKNIPKLLQRCLDSIPQREDLEVIVVDDNSEPDIVDFENFPGLDRKDTAVIFDKSGKGAGRARNIGLEHARGKWLLFADADDYFNYCIRDILDEYMMDESDIVFFSASSVDCETYNNVGRSDYIKSFISTYFENKRKGELLLRYDHGAPWSKLINKELVCSHNISFQETLQHNDTRFSYLIGYFGKNIKVDRRAIYCLTNRTMSITNTSSPEKYKDRVQVLCERYAFLRDHNIPLENKFLFVNPLADLVEKKQNETYQKCSQIVCKFGFTHSQIDSLVKKELDQRKKMRREDWVSLLRNQIAMRTRLRKLFNC